MSNGHKVKQKFWYGRNALILEQIKKLSLYRDNCVDNPESST